MNLYSGGTRHLELREAYSKVLQAKLEMAKATRKVDNEVTQAYIGLGNAKIALQVAKKQLKLAKRSFELTEARYKTGVATPVEVSDALTALQSARIATLREELNFELAILQLRRAVGLFNP
jgi:outer membrane protein TolC